MADELDIARERLRQQRARDVAGVAGAPKLVATPEQRMGLAFKPGDRVRDLVTGQEGIVEQGQRVTVIVPNTDG